VIVKNSDFSNNNIVGSNQKGAGINVESGLLVVMGSTFTSNAAAAGQTSPHLPVEMHTSYRLKRG
jgi:hypothetical protein